MDETNRSNGPKKINITSDATEMPELAERYIYDVTRRLPEKDREEIKRELTANISDMLPDNPDERDVIRVLKELGAPRILVEQYRQKPQFLISPALFDTYISVLKTVTMIVAIVLGCMEAISVFLSGSLGINSIADVLNAAFLGALQAAFWVTIGFVIAEKCGYKQEDWHPDDLPPLPNIDGVKIPRSTSIIGMALSVIFTGLLITMITHNAWFFAVTRIDGVFINAFSPEASIRLIPFILLFGFLGFVKHGLTFYWGRWNVPICLTHIVHNVIYLAVIIHVLSWPDLLNVELVQRVAPILTDIAEDIGIATVTSVTWRQAILVPVVIGVVIEIGTGVYNTWKGRG